MTLAIRGNCHDQCVMSIKIVSLMGDFYYPDRYTVFVERKSFGYCDNYVTQPRYHMLEGKVQNVFIFCTTSIWCIACLK